MLKPILLAAMAALPFEPAAVMSGLPSVKDGDGILFGRIEVRLQGIAAPEDSNGKRERGGPEATKGLERLIRGQMVTCYLDGTVAGKSMRPAGVCFVGDVEINAALVKAGHARDCPGFSRGRYSEAERSARENGRDLSQIYELPSYCME